MQYKKRVVRRPFKPAKRAKTIIKRALEIAKSGEWTKSYYARDIDEGEIGFCAVGMLRVANGAMLVPENNTNFFTWNTSDNKDYKTDSYLEATHAVMRGAGIELDGPYDDVLACEDLIINFNDRSSTTANDVIKALERALDEV